MISSKTIVERFIHPIDGEPVSPNLNQYLEDFYMSIVQTPVELHKVKNTILNLMKFLSTDEGRTNANCVTVDNFVKIEDHWEKSWRELPEKYVEVIELMGDSLHDTISTPDIAINFSCTPEQILELAMQLLE
jgi:hypothetical protein